MFRRYASKKLNLRKLYEDDKIRLMLRQNLIKISEARIFPPDSFDEYFEDDFSQTFFYT